MSFLGFFTKVWPLILHYVFVFFPLDTPLLVRSSSDSAITPQQIESEACPTEDSAGMVRPCCTNVPSQSLVLKTYNKYVIS